MTNDRSGFTIIEVLISMVILVLALFALSSLQTVSIGSNASSQQRTIATILAQDKMEELKSLAYTDSQLSDTSANYDQNQNYFDWSLAVDHTNVDGLGSVANPIDENGNNVASNGYTRVWNVVDDIPARNMKLISVRVSWSFKGGRAVTVDGIISRE